MRKTVLTILSASALLLSTLPTNTHSEQPLNIATPNLLLNEAAYSFEGVQYDKIIALKDDSQKVSEVAYSYATAKSGSYTLKYNTNVRSDAGTKNKILTVGKKGAAATATHQKKVGSQVWYKVKISGKHGWVLSTLLAPKSAAASKTTAISGSYKLKYNSNVRANAGTNNKIITYGKKGATVKASAAKKVGNATWYRVAVNGKVGWVLSTLLTKTSVAAKAPVKAAVATAAASGTYKTTYKSNVRANAGTNYKVVTLAKKGTTVKVSASKKVGSVTWFKITANGKVGWISGALLTKTTAAVVKASSSVSSSAITSTALSLKGVPYRFGGTTPAGFDCSGFIQYVFKQHGISVSRTTLTQFAETTTVSSPKPGDLVFFANTYRAGISHVGIYIGNNQFVHSGGAKAEVKSLNDVYWGPKFHSFKRF